MSDEPASEPKPKGVKLSDLMPTKTAVPTSLGTLFVRGLSQEDWRHFGEVTEPQALGCSAVHRLCGRVEDQSDRTGLSDEDHSRLTEADIDALIPAIVRRNGWGEVAPRTLAALG